MKARFITPRSAERRYAVGFSLIELAAALGIVALLATIAIPSYQRYLDAARRTDGKTALLEWAHQLERCWTISFSYRTEDGCPVVFPQTSSQTFYQIAAPQRERNAYTLEAVPQGIQERDRLRCGTLTLTHRGIRGSRGEIGTDAASCW